MANNNKDLLDVIEFSSLECLNEKPGKTAANAIKQGYRDQDDLVLESDADEQLLINIPFQNKVKLQSICIKGPSDGTGPKTVKLYVNRASCGFSDVSAAPPAQEFQLTTTQLEGEIIPLKFVKFQSVNVLTVFIEDNQGAAEATKLIKLAVYGQSGDTFNVAEIKKVEDK